VVSSNNGSCYTLELINKIKRIALIIYLFLFLSLLCPGGVSAATQVLSTDNVPLAIDQSQEFNVDITFSCSSCTTDSYLRGVFYPSGTSYFGYTQDNNGNWSNAAGGNCTTYFKIAQTDMGKEGTWSGTLKVKPDVENPYYGGPGEYLFKVGRYTPSCSSASVWSTEETIAITGPTPTPTSAPTSTSVPTSVPTNTPTPKPASNAAAATATPKPTQKPIPSISNKFIATRTGVLGESSGSSKITEEPEKIEVLSAKDNTIVSKILILIGIVFLVACAIVFFYPYIIRFKNKNIHE
jgi:hypothetical protein